MLGVGWALSYLLLLASLASQNRYPARMLWAVLCAEVLAVALRWHHDAAQIVTTCIVGTFVLAGAAAMSALTRDLQLSPAATSR